MPRNNELLEERNALIYSRYKELYDINFLRHDKVLEKLSSEYFLREKTIERIVFKVKATPKNDKEN
jgi:hypothetical protein